MKNFFKILFCILLLFNPTNSATCNSESCSVSCTGHDACKNSVWNGPYVISCGASNSERTCRGTTLNCGDGDTCSIKTTGSGHDAYQTSTVNAKEADSFTLTCTASGQRDCKTITVWCPQKSGTTCNCVSCPNTVTMKCVQGIGCSSTSNANVDYVESEITPVSPSCINIINKTIYHNETVYIYRNISDYFYDDKMLANICEEGLTKYYTSPTNEAWTRKSWNVGCNHVENGANTLSQCKTKCNCASSPTSYSSHSQYHQCSKNSASTNYITCRQNSCSGGNCCSRSATICKNACKAYYAVKFSGEMITYKDVDVLKYHDVNKTQYINVTRNLTRYFDLERLINKTRWLNKTIFTEKIRWIDKINQVNKTRWLNKTRVYNKTRWIDKIKWIEKVNNTIREIIIEVPKYRNITIYHNETIYTYDNISTNRPIVINNRHPSEHGDMTMSNNSSKCTCEKVNNNVITWQVTTVVLGGLLVIYFVSRECICSKAMEILDICDKIANICMCCKELCCGEEEEEERDAVHIEATIINYGPNPILVRETDMSNRKRVEI